MVPYFCLLLVIFGQWIMLFPHGQISFNKPINKSQKSIYCINMFRINILRRVKINKYRC